MSENEVPDEERLQQLQDDIDSARKNAEDAELLDDTGEREPDGNAGDDTGKSGSDGDDGDDGDEGDTGERESDSDAGDDGDEGDTGERESDDGDGGDDTGEREFHKSGDEESQEMDDQTIAPPG